MHMVRGHQVYSQKRMSLEKFRQKGNDLPDAECRWHGNPKGASQAIDSSGRVVGFVKVVKDASCPFEKDCSRVRGGNATSVPKQQLHADPRFELGDDPGH
jgi:hypothetical protein